MLESTEDKFNWTERIIDECQIEYPVHKVIQGKRSTCVDVGANVGGFMINFHFMFDKIHAYEASEDNLNFCKSNLRARDIDNVEFFHEAVHSKDGETLRLKKYSSTENCGSYGVVDFQYGEDGDGWTEDKGFEEVGSVSLETILERSGDIDVLKVDVEGAEYEFMYGKDLSRVNYIFMEMHNFLIDMGVQEQLVKWICKTHKLLTPYNPQYKDYHQQLIFARV